jgi:hypothetical protein
MQVKGLECVTFGAYHEPSLKDPSSECFDQIENDMDLDNFLK